jgi:hypothetical protein
MPVAPWAHYGQKMQLLDPFWGPLLDDFLWVPFLVRFLNDFGSDLGPILGASNEPR